MNNPIDKIEDLLGVSLEWVSQTDPQYPQYPYWRADRFPYVFYVNVTSNKGISWAIGTMEHPQDDSYKQIVEGLGQLDLETAKTNLMIEARRRKIL